MLRSSSTSTAWSWDSADRTCASFSSSSASAVSTAELRRVSSSWLIARLSFTCSANSSWRRRSSLCARATSAWALATARACCFMLWSAFRWRVSSSKSGSPCFTVWPAVTKTSRHDGGERRADGDVLGAGFDEAHGRDRVREVRDRRSVPAALSASRCGCVRAIEKVAQRRRQQADNGQDRVASCATSCLWSWCVRCAVRARDLPDPAVVHVRDAVGEVEDAGVVGHHDHGAVRPDGALRQQLHHRLAVRGVERGRRLVADDEARLVDQRPGERDALLLAARELRGERASVRSPRPRRASSSLARGTACFLASPAASSGTATFSAAVSAGSRLYCWNRKPTFLRRNSTRSASVQLVHRPAEDPELAARALEQAGDDRDQRRLAAAARSDQEAQLPEARLEVDAAQRLDAGLALAEVLRHAAALDGQIGFSIADAHPRKTAAGSSTSTRRMLSTLATIATNRMQAPVRATFCHISTMPRVARTCERDLEERGRHAGAEREAEARRRERLQQDHPDQAAVRDADRLERAELLQVLEREQVEGLAGDDRAHDERHADRDAEVDRDAGVLAGSSGCSPT